MEPGSEFNFRHLPQYKFSCLEKTEINENLAKWSMSDGLRLQAYSFDKPFKKYNEREFLANFLGCQNVAATLLTATSTLKLSPFDVPATEVKFSEIKCTLTSLELFDKLKIGEKVVRQNGYIVKCMPHYIKAVANNDNGQTEGFEIEIADNLRKIFLSNQEDSEDYDEVIDGIRSEIDMKEFLFSLFSHLVIGGCLCQYEDSIEPYVVTTKLLYKDLIAVAASAEDGNAESKKNFNNDGNPKKLKIISHVYKIHSAANGSSPVEKKNLLFHCDYLNNFLYIIVNPLKQTCFTLYHHA